MISFSQETETDLSPASGWSFDSKAHGIRPSLLLGDICLIVVININADFIETPVTARPSFSFSIYMDLNLASFISVVVLGMTKFVSALMISFKTHYHEKIK